MNLTILTVQHACLECVPGQLHSNGQHACLECVPGQLHSNSRQAARHMTHTQREQLAAQALVTPGDITSIRAELDGVKTFRWWW